MQKSNVLKLKNALNFRDLGGYKSAHGGTVKRNMLYRSDSLANLTDSDIDTILSKNIRTVIDLRTEYETSLGESKLKNIDKISYYNISLIDDVHSNDASSFANSFPASMGKLYTDLLDNSSSKIIEVFRIILDNRSGGVVFNCTAGKDRTGIIAALFLDMLCVSREDIVNDYIVTEQLMEPIFKNMKAAYDKAAGKKVPRHIFESKRESIEEFLNHLYSEYGSAKNYLSENGLGKNNINIFLDTYLTV